MIERDLKGIKRALLFLVTREMNSDLSQAHCDAVNNHGYVKGDIEKGQARVMKVYNPILEGLK